MMCEMMNQMIIFIKLSNNKFCVLNIYIVPMCITYRILLSLKNVKLKNIYKEVLRLNNTEDLSPTLYYYEGIYLILYTILLTFFAINSIFTYHSIGTYFTHVLNIVMSFSINLFTKSRLVVKYYSKLIS